MIDHGERRIDTFQVARSDQALGKLFKPSNIVLKVELLTDMTLLKMGMAMFINLIRRKSFVLSVLCLFLFPSFIYGQEMYERIFDLDTYSNSIYYKNYKGDLDSNFVVPDTIYTSRVAMPVKGIDLGAFSSRKELKSIRLPKHLETIGFEAFRGCVNLESIYLPHSVQSIDESAFVLTNLLSVEVGKNNLHFDSRGNCNAVIDSHSNTIIVGSATTDIPHSVVSIGKNAFSGRRELKRISIPSNVKEINDAAFSDCVSLQEISFGSIQSRAADGLRSIGQFAFSRCSKLRNIILPSTLTRIGTGAFYDCTSLKGIRIPASVDSIGCSPFAECQNLESITIEKGNGYYDSRNGCNAVIEKKTRKLIAGCKNSFIPKGVRIIGQDAFAGINGIVEMAIPEGVEEIEQGAFRGCESLESMVLPRSLRMMMDCFDKCSNLKQIIVHSRKPPHAIFSESDEYKKIVLCVPNGCVKEYENSNWYVFGKIVELKK